MKVWRFRKSSFLNPKTVRVILECSSGNKEDFGKEKYVVKSIITCCICEEEAKAEWRNLGEGINLFSTRFGEAQSLLQGGKAILDEPLVKADGSIAQ